MQTLNDTALTVQDVQVPRLGFGTWQLTGDTCTTAVEAAIDAGYRHIDTAQIYGNEEEVGRAIANSGVDRDDLFVVTKVWRKAANADNVVLSTQTSLEKLGLDHVDLLHLHWPSDDIAPLEETLDAMSSMIGKQTRLIGVCNFPSDQLERALELAPIACNQLEHHPFLGIDQVKKVARDADMFLTAYSPIAQGAVADDSTINDIAEEHGKTPHQVALRWLLQTEGMTAIPRSSDPDHVTSNFDVFDFELSTEQVDRINALERGERLINPDFAPDWD